MPILTATGAVADLVCAVCATEWHMTMGDWLIPDSSDDSIIGAECPGCGSQEWFTWHDWVYLGPPIPNVTPGDPDPSHMGAKQMVLIERIAQVLGRSKRSIPDRPASSYPQAPTAPTQAAVRAYVAQIRGNP
jgi:hypothetical protein